MEWYEKAFDRYYPVLYGHRDDGEAARVLSTYGDRLAGRSPILDLASGEGRYLGALLSAGFDAYGLDLSLYLLQRSAERPQQRGRVLQGDMRALPFADGAFGAVINMFTSFGYFSVDTDNLLVVREIHRVLRPEGVFLLDYINAEKISQSLLDETQRRSGGYDIHERRRVVDYGKYLLKHVDVRHSETGEHNEFEERLRLYTRDDLTTMLHSAGMRVIDVFGDYEGNEFARGVSERVIILAEKG
jgi:SAM-dependent methyltransferase